MGGRSEYFITYLTPVPLNWKFTELLTSYLNLTTKTREEKFKLCICNPIHMIYYIFTICSLIWIDIVVIWRFSPRIQSWHSKMWKTCFSVSTITRQTFYRNLNGQTLIYYWNMMVLTKKYFSLKLKIFCLLNNDLWFWDPAQP